MTLVAGIWVKSLTGSDAAAALVSVCVFAPALLAPLAGLLADRVARRRLLMLVNAVAAVGLLPLLLVRSDAQVWLVFVVMLGYGAVLVVVDPAETALFTELVPAEERARLNGLRLTIQEGAKLLVPLAGAGLFALLGGGLVAALDALTFLVAAIVVALLHTPDAPPQGDQRLPWRREVLAGLSQLRAVPSLGRLVIVAALAVAASGVAVAAQYALVDALSRPPAFLGVLTSLLGAGSILAGLTSGRLLHRADERRLVLFGLLAGAAGYLLIASGWLPAVVLGWLVRGFSLPWIVIAAITAGQRLTPDHLQGRVAAAITLLLFAAQPLTQAAGAALIVVLDYQLVYVLVAAFGLFLVGPLRTAGWAEHARA
jgi:MFS family permease